MVAKNNLRTAGLVSGLICLLAPIIMGAQEWDDHDRSNKLLAPDIARDYLESCPPNAILFTFGDNDTYPLWYAQEVEGVREDVVVIESAPSHYSHKTAADWLGIGQGNLLKVSSHPDQTTNLEELEEKTRNALKSGKKIACIIAVGGTTSNMGIDDIQNIHDMRERLAEEFNLPYKPHIHVDSVLGWAFLNFRSYNFKENSLQFNPKTLSQLKKILE